MNPVFKRMPQVPRRTSENKSIPMHIVMRLQNMKGNIQKALRAAREKTENRLSAARDQHISS